MTFGSQIFRRDSSQIFLVLHYYSPLRFSLIFGVLLVFCLFLRIISLIGFAAFWYCGWSFFGILNLDNAIDYKFNFGTLLICSLDLSF